MPANYTVESCVQVMEFPRLRQPVLHSSRHPLIDLLPDLGTPRLSTRTACQMFLFLENPTPRICNCAGYYPDALSVLLHLWDTHVQEKHDWTEEQVSEWLDSVSTDQPGR